jgi:hypothetical protein
MTAPSGLKDGKNIWQRFMAKMTQNQQDSLSMIAGQKSVRFIDSAQTNKQYRSLVVNEETVLSNLKGGPIGGTQVDYIALIGLSGKTLSVGMIITPDLDAGHVFSEVTPASGSLLGYL